MPGINMIFELGQDEALDEMARTVQDRLNHLDVVQEVEAVPETAAEMRMTGLEVVAAIGVTVVVVRHSSELVAEVRKLVTEIKGLMLDLRDLKNVYVDVGDERVPIDELSDDHLRQLAKVS